jgi:hypothetical protein
MKIPYKTEPKKRKKNKKKMKFTYPIKNREPMSEFATFFAEEPPHGATNLRASAVSSETSTHPLTLQKHNNINI